jgi:hypothetical protein
MKNFYIALMTYFNTETAEAHNSFYDDIGGRLFQGDAPDGTAYPYCVFMHIVDTQIDTFKNKMDDIIIQFSIFSEQSSSVEVHDAMTHLKSLLDDCELSISGGDLVSFFRITDGLQREEVTTPSGEQMIWHFHCDYHAVFERA